MPLPALNHRRLATVTVAAPNNVEDVMDAIWTALTAATYYDGTARVPGAGSAWTAAREVGAVTESVRFQPPEAAVSDFYGAVAGLNGAAAPTMLAPDAYVANEVLGCIFRNVPGVPVWNGWQNATPFTGADFAGWYRGPVATSIERVVVVESQESLIIGFYTATALKEVKVFHAGLEPGQADEGEASNGRIYGYTTQGTGALQAEFWIRTSTLSGAFWGYNAGNGAQHSYVFDPFANPGNNIQTVIVQTGAQQYNATSNSGPNGSQVGESVKLEYNSGPWSGYHLAFVRGHYRISDQLGAGKFERGGVDQMYFLSQSRIGTADALGLPY